MKNELQILSTIRLKKNAVYLGEGNAYFANFTSNNHGFLLGRALTNQLIQCSLRLVHCSADDPFRRINHSHTSVKMKRFYRTFLTNIVCINRPRTTGDTRLIFFSRASFPKIFTSFNSFLAVSATACSRVQPAAFHSVFISTKTHPMPYNKYGPWSQPPDELQTDILTT